MSMKGREAKGAPSADLLVCFPSRAHLTLMPKPICSPARPSEPNKTKRHQPHIHHHHHHRRKSTTRFAGLGGGGLSSPALWSKTKPNNTEISEPSSPKVTCAGQIKVRPRTNSCKNWQSVMEEIERLHTNRKHKKKTSWVESIGFKKDVMQFLACLRSIKFDFRCFGSFPTPTEITSDDDEEEEEEEEEEEASKTVFSKWFMVLQENKAKETPKTEQTKGARSGSDDCSVHESFVPAPANALLLMRCRSAPAKSWLEEKEEEEEDKKEKVIVREEKKREERESLEMVMRYDSDFHKLSIDIAKETWVHGGEIRDPFSRSRSWRR